MPNTLFDAIFAPLAGRTTPLLILPDGGTISGDAFLRLIAGQAQTLPDADFDLYVGFYTQGTGTHVLTCNFNEADWVHAAPEGFTALP